MDLSAFLTLPVMMAIAFAGSILILFIGLQIVLSGRNEVIETRLERYATRPAVGARQGPSQRARGDRFEGLLNEERSSSIATELARADLRLTPGEYVAINLVSILLGAFLGLMLGGGLVTSGLIFALAGALIGFYGPRLYVRLLQRRRLNAFNNQLGDTIVLLSNSLRSGYSLLQSMETASKELSAPMSEELQRVTREVGLGLTMQTALANMYRRMPSDDLDLLITAINVQHEVGGNLAEILDNIAHTIRERVRIMGEIRTITAQQRLSGYILAVLPVLLGFLIYLLNPGYISHLWENTCGLLMLGTGVLMMVLGFVAIRKITNIEV
jgi:tight adherence protein B